MYLDLQTLLATPATICVPPDDPVSGEPADKPSRQTTGVPTCPCCAWRQTDLQPVEPLRIDSGCLYRQPELTWMARHLLPITDPGYFVSALLAVPPTPDVRG